MSEETKMRCAEAMGWKVHRWTRGQHSYTHWAKPGEFEPDVNSEFFRQRLGVPNWHEDLNAAVTLCDKLAEEGWATSIDGWPGTWRCCFQRHKSGTIDCVDIHQHSAPTLAEAICGCFLKCKGLLTEGDLG